MKWRRHADNSRIRNEASGQTQDTSGQKILNNELRSDHQFDFVILSEEICRPAERRIEGSLLEVIHENVS